jgi:hypothetical protein
MAPTRRTVLAGGALAFATGLAGCSGQPLASFSASPATVSPSTLQGTGYEETSVDERVVSQGFGPADQAVEVRNWLARYERPLAPTTVTDLVGTPSGGNQPVAVFIALSTPAVSVAGREFNPVAGLSANDIVERVQSAYSELREVERVGERTVAALDTTVTLVEYRAESSVRGIAVDGLTDVSVHVSDPVEHGSDFVVVVGAHPALLVEERGTVDQLLAGVQHDPGDAQEN